jgi:NAD(P)-dependent dehydrogenase (short-subunit alcohol dehydrogenase family)
VCIVTGATWPIGRAIVLELAGEYIRPFRKGLLIRTQHTVQLVSTVKSLVRRLKLVLTVIACSNSSEDDYVGLVKEVEVNFPNTKVIGYPYKQVDEEETLALLDEILNTWGRLDVWICSSGLLGPASIDETSPNDLRKCFEANSMAPFFALKYGPPAMAKTTPKGNYPNAAPKDQKYGSIVVVSSIASSYGGCYGPAFTMTSHAALGVVRSGVAVLKGKRSRARLKDEN